MLSKTEFVKLPVFITSMSRWDGDTSSASLALAKVLARTNRVYYIDFPFSLTDFLRQRHETAVKQRTLALLGGKNLLNPVPGKEPNLKSVTPKLVLPFYNLQPGWKYRVFAHLNNRIMAHSINSVLRAEGIKEYLFLNSFNPSYLSRVGSFLKPVLSIYQSRDAIEETHTPSIGREDTCVKHYDLSIGTSVQICNNIQRRTGVAAAHLPNGGDVQLFSAAMKANLARPAALENIRTPIIGYTGAICQRIDYALLGKIAVANPDKTIVLVGPVRQEHSAGFNWSAFSNIVLLGPKKIEELPALLRCFDCAIIPFRCNKLTAGIYPLKINEYLAAGKPVVTTNFSADIASFGPHVSLAKSPEDFVAKIQAALATDSSQKREERLRVATANSWEHRVERFWELAWNAYTKKAVEPDLVHFPDGKRRRKEGQVFQSKKSNPSA